MADYRRQARKLVTTIWVFAGVTALSGCGGFDGVELNGKVFEALGMSGDTFSKRAEPRTEARAPLVLPPEANKLPEPGSSSAPAAAVADQSWPQDREQQRVSEAAAKKKQHDAYCRDGNWKEKATKDEIAAANGPQGSCNGSLLKVMTDALMGSKE